MFTQNQLGECKFKVNPAQPKEKSDLRGLGTRWDGNSYGRGG